MQQRQCSVRGLLPLLLLILLTTTVDAWPKKKADKSIEEQLIDWVVAKGGKLVRAAWLQCQGRCREWFCNGRSLMPAPVDACPPCRLPAARSCAQSGFEIGQACPTCLRGVVASKDLQPDDVILKVPFTAVMRLRWVWFGGRGRQFRPAQRLACWHRTDRAARHYNLAVLPAGVHTRRSSSSSRA